MQTMTISPPATRAASRPREPQRRADSEATRQRILDCAEKLFADASFHATSIRDIANLADCQFALVGYHFGTKAELLDHVLARRSEVLNRERMERLESLRSRSKNRPIPLRDLIESFVRTIMERTDEEDEGWRNYTRLIAAIAANAEWSQLAEKHFNAVARHYLEEMQRTLPEVSGEHLHHAFFFMIGAMVTVCARPDRIETLSKGRFDSRAVAALVDSLCTFLEGGFGAIASREKSSKSTVAGTRRKSAGIREK